MTPNVYTCLAFTIYSHVKSLCRKTLLISKLWCLGIQLMSGSLWFGIEKRSRNPYTSVSSLTTVRRWVMAKSAFSVALYRSRQVPGRNAQRLVQFNLTQEAQWRQRCSSSYHGSPPFCPVAARGLHRVYYQEENCFFPAWRLPSSQPQLPGPVLWSHQAYEQ